MTENQEPQEDEVNMEVPDKPISTMKILEKSKKESEDKD